MLSANQIARFLNQLFLQNKLMKQHHFKHYDTNLQKLIENFLFGYGQKWVWPIWSLDSKIDYLKKNRWN